MATEFALLDENLTFFTSDGSLASGYQLFIYEAGSTTKATTHKDSDGLVANTNPIILDSLGQTPWGVYVATGDYKTVLATDTDSDPPATPIRTRDNITARNDTLSVAQSEWIVGPTPTYISATSFSLVGDQTSVFHVGRRVKLTDSGGVSYATIRTTTYTSLTTIELDNDASDLDSGLSAVSYSVLGDIYPSVPPWIYAGYEHVADVTASSDALFVFSHDGIDTSSPIDLVFGFTYALEWSGIYGDVDASQIMLKVYEGGAYREAASSYYNFWHGVYAGSTSVGDGANTAAFASQSIFGTTGTLSASGYMIFRNLATTNYISEGFGTSVGNSTSVINTYTNHWRVHTGGNLNLATSKLKVYPATSTEFTAGRFRWYRRRDI